MSPEGFTTDQPPARRLRPRRPRRRANQVALICFLCSAAAFWWYGLAGADQDRRLAILHEAKAVRCRDRELRARATGDDGAARVLARTAANHDSFARAYRRRSEQPREQTIELFRSIGRKIQAAVRRS